MKTKYCIQKYTTSKTIKCYIIPEYETIEYKKHAIVTYEYFLILRERIENKSIEELRKIYKLVEVKEL